MREARELAGQGTKEICLVAQDLTTYGTDLRGVKQTSLTSATPDDPTAPRLASLLRVISTGDGKPIGNAAAIFKDLSAELKVQIDRLEEVLITEMAAFNAEARRAGLDPIAPKQLP